jgi:hypothetical protein
MNSPRALVAVMIAACSSGSAPPATTPIQGQAPHRAAPTTPPPAIDWRDGAFVMTGLPAIARDGGLVVAPLIESDGGRGFANLQIELRDRRDKRVMTIPVMTANEFEALVPDGRSASPALVSRIAATNRRLAGVHTDYDLVPMQAIDPGGLSIDFTARGWLAPPGQRCAQCPPCENPPYLDAVYKADGIDVRLVRVAYRGTDLCWEPTPQWHVVRQ